jgi:hypothetical protein
MRLVEFFTSSIPNWIKISPLVDEKLCRGEKWFKCRDETCISSSLICDHEADCRDASDESDELCDGKLLKRPKCDTETQFDCGDGECIPKKYACDGNPNCLNGKDEDPVTCKNVSSFLVFLKRKFD